MQNRSDVVVVGGGIAGITASLDLADGGYEVILLEREPALGGHMVQLSRTFPDLDPAVSGILSKALEVEKHPKIDLHCYSELEDVKGYVGNFDLVIKKKATYLLIGLGIALIIILGLTAYFHFEGFLEMECGKPFNRKLYK
jgi:heterodisulfide reductase subunit A-like polyferredoxin